MSRCVRDSVLVEVESVARRKAAAADVSGLFARKVDSGLVAERRGVVLSERAFWTTAIN